MLLYLTCFQDLDTKERNNLVIILYLQYNLLKLKLLVLVGLLSAVQPFSNPLTLTSPGHWSMLGNQHSGLPGETISLQVLSAAIIWCPGISNLHRHRPLKVPIHTQVEWSLGDSFLVPREIHIKSLQHSNQGSVLQCAITRPTHPLA